MNTKDTHSRTYARVQDMKKKEVTMVHKTTLLAVLLLVVAIAVPFMFVNDVEADLPTEDTKWVDANIEFDPTKEQYAQMNRSWFVNLEAQTAAWGKTINYVEFVPQSASGSISISIYSVPSDAVADWDSATVQDIYDAFKDKYTLVRTWTFTATGLITGVMNEIPTGAFELGQYQFIAVGKSCDTQAFRFNGSHYGSSLQYFNALDTFSPGDLGVSFGYNPALPNNVTIRYHANPNDYSETQETYSQAFSAAVNLKDPSQLETPYIDENKTFVGWFTDTGCNNAITTASAPCDIDVYAGWLYNDVYNYLHG